jgi:hypothetical protein
MRALSLALLVALAWPDDPARADDRLSRADAAYLDSLLKEFIFDPTGAERVRVSPRGDYPQDGWLVKGTAGRPDRVVFTDGFTIPAPPPDRIERIDFLAQAEQFFNARPPADADVEAWIREQARATFRSDDHFVALAAWYHRLGHDRFAAEALDVARALSADPRAELRKHLRYHPFWDTYAAFGSGDDRRVVEVGSHYLRVYADDEPERTTEVRSMVRDAERRLASASLGQSRHRQTRVDDGRWPPARRVAALIDALEHTNVFNAGGGGGPPPFDRCPTVTGLVACGDLAVPTLIDTFERDDRLTRVQISNINLDSFPKKYCYHSVREAALFAVRSIWQLDHFPPAPGQAEDPRDRAEYVARLRHYRKTFGCLTPDERMMRHLTDEGTPSLVCRQAAANLAGLQRPGGPSEYWCWSSVDRWDEDALPDRPARPRPAAARFTGPAAAEAVLAAADRDPAAVQTEHIYLNSLIALGDERIAPELGRRAAASPHPDVRRRYAFAALRLGAPAEWDRFVRDVERGRIVLERAGPRPLDVPAADAERDELTKIVLALIRAKTVESERALAALTSLKHPYYAHARAAVGDRQNRVWTSHPVCLTVLRHHLYDDQPTGGLFEIRDREFVRGPADAGFYAMHYDEWADLRQFHTAVEERIGDAAGRRLSELVIGMPFFHPLCKDADERIERLDRFLGTHRDRVRRGTDEERAALHLRNDDGLFIPGIQPLGRPATAADVKAGRAVFHLNGEGRVWTGPVPRTVALKSDAGKKSRPVGLVVQAEADANGKAVFGVIFRYEIRLVRADEIAP